VSAIEALARKVPDVNALTDPSRGLFVSVGLVRGGRRRSVVPGLCTAVVDVRAADAGGWKSLETGLAAIVARQDLPGSSGSLSIHAHRPAVPWTSATDRLIGVASQAGEALGVPFGVIRSGAGGSSAFAGPLGVPVLDGMGPSGGGLMTDREHIQVASLAERAALLALTLHLLGAERKST
jgi:glutamate carboxypeptidase